MRQEEEKNNRTGNERKAAGIRNRDLLIRYMEEQAALGHFEKIDLDNLSSKQIEMILDATNSINEFRELMMYYSC